MAIDAWARVGAHRCRRSACLTIGPRSFLAGRGFPRAVAARAFPHPSPTHARGTWACAVGRAGSSGRRSSRRARTTCCGTFHRSVTWSRFPSSSPAINICRTMNSVTLSRRAVSRVLCQSSTNFNGNLTPPLTQDSVGEDQGPGAGVVDPAAQPNARTLLRTTSDLFNSTQELGGLQPL
jgi:hypothetical protein